jgi:hypothetical protein
VKSTPEEGQGIVGRKGGKVKRRKGKMEERETYKFDEIM